MSAVSRSTVLPLFDELFDRVERGGPEAVVDMRPDYSHEIGTIDDAHAHVAAVEAAGLGSITIFPGHEIAIAWEQLPLVAEFARR